MNRRLILVNEQVRRRAQEAVRDAPAGWEVLVKEPTRNSEQNAKLWALLTDVAEQVEWHGKRLSPEDWKHVFSASLRRLTVVPNLDGTGFVALGMSTSKLSRREFSDLIELVQAFGAERGVAWSDEMETV